jgi:hypothetical protein
MECIRTFQKAFDRGNHGLLCFNLMRSFSGTMLACFWSYLTGHNQCIRFDDFLSDVIYCHSGVPQGSHLSLLFFINNVDEVFRIFQLVFSLGYANDLKLFMNIESVYDCHRFQSDLQRLQEWCSGRKLGLTLNAAKCKPITFNRNKKLIGLDYRIERHEFVEEIKNLGVILDSSMSF